MSIADSGSVRLVIALALLVALVVAFALLESSAVDWATDWLLPPSKSGGG